MGKMNVKLKLMPTSPSVNLENIKKKAKELVEKRGGTNSQFQEEPIAFGLKAVIMTFIWPEEKELEETEEMLKRIQDVSSEEIIDLRRTV